MKTNIVPLEFPKALRQSEHQAKTSVKTFHAALGAFILLVEQHLPVEQHELFHDHAIDIDNAVNALYADHGQLLSAVAAYAALASELRLQRDDLAYEYKDAQDRAEEAESTAHAHIYQRLLTNIEETFNCSRETADKILCALWDEYADVDAQTSDTLDCIANIIGGD